MSSSAASGAADPSRDARLPVPVICGPTAAGKSGVAMWLAERRAVTIVSADSRQVYRRFDIGTAKPTADERRRVPHCGIDVVEPTERYSAAAWAQLAQAAITEALAAGRLPVIVGGTGFYMRALFAPLFHEPELDDARRRAIQRELDRLPAAELRRWCGALDPARAHLGRAQLSRAVEVALLTGSRLSELHVARAREARVRASYLLVDPGADLGRRIAARASAMFDAGWVEEVRGLMDVVPPDAPAWRATGYDAVRQFARGGMSRAAALERVVIETRQYAKRQRTWFRNQLRDDAVRRLAPGVAGDALEEVVMSWLADVEAAMRRAEPR